MHDSTLASLYWLASLEEAGQITLSDNAGLSDARLAKLRTPNEVHDVMLASGGFGQSTISSSHFFLQFVTRLTRQVPVAVVRCPYLCPLAWPYGHELCGLSYMWIKKT